MQGNTRQAILERAIDLFSESGYQKVSVRDIAAAVGIKGASIYNHFSSKEDILSEIIGDCFKKIFRTLSLTPTKELLEKYRDSTFEETMDDIFAKFDPLDAPRMKKMYKIVSSEQFTNIKAATFWKYHAICGSVSRLRALFDDMVKTKKIPPINTLRAAEILIRLSFSYTYQFMHDIDGDDSESSISMYKLNDYIYDLIKRGEI